jgi:hypothetical protein
MIKKKRVGPGNKLTLLQSYYNTVGFKKIFDHFHFFNWKSFHVFLLPSEKKKLYVKNISFYLVFQPCLLYLSTLKDTGVFHKLKLLEINFKFRLEANTAISYFLSFGLYQPVPFYVFMGCWIHLLYHRVCFILCLLQMSSSSCHIVDVQEIDIWRAIKL